MKRFFTRIVVCLLPTVLSVVVVAWAFVQWNKDSGGFRLGVDLVGGTILVYEVDETKMPENFKAEDLAAALKRRIDPADLYNITIRPVPGNPPRVEIILPTGGKHRAEVEQRNWEALLKKAFEDFAGKARDSGENPYLDIKRNGEDGGPPALKDAIADNNPEIPVEQISAWIEKNALEENKGKRLLTSEEVQNIKNLIEKQGRLEFRILANDRDDADAINAAKEYFKSPKNKTELERLNDRAEPPPPPRKEDGSLLFPVNLPDEPAHGYSWIELGKSELHSLKINSDNLKKNPNFSAIIDRALASGESFELPPHSGLFYVRKITDWTRRASQLKDRELGKEREYFALVRDPLRGQEITGDYLVNANPGFHGSERSIEFQFNSEGGNLFYDVTSRNKPSGSSGALFHRNLAIVFDGQILSAPSLNEPIHTRGQITGVFTQKEVDDFVRMLRAGALPATLKKDPASENSMGATLGQDTIEKGTSSVLWAFLAVMAFMVFYYRFAGLVACVALLANLMLTVAVMVLLQAAFTLPGLAGLVLMLGMAVDANVLIYERLREERDRGATLALAIRNGYDRAFPTIVDTHLSSIFTAIVLYVVGNDQLKGFGISLTFGLIISLFTSLVMTRTIFDIWLYKGWLKKLSFFGGLVKAIHARYWDFMAIRYYWFTATIALTVLGAGLFIYRLDSDQSRGKSSVLNIDFIGGTAYSALLTEPMTLKELREKLEPESLPPDQRLPDLSFEQTFVTSDKSTTSDKSRYFTVRTSEKDAKKVFAYVQDRLRNELKRIRAKVEILKPGLEAKMTFTSETGATDYASPAQVQMLVSDELAKNDLPRGGFQIIPPGKQYVVAEKTLQSLQSRGVPDAVIAKLKPLVGKELDGQEKFEEALKKELGTAETDRLKYKLLSLAKRDVEREGRYSELLVKMNELLYADKDKSVKTFSSILNGVKEDFERAPQPERLENFDSQLAANTRERAMYAILASWAAILLYLWFRFGSWTFGAATVLCLIHDLFFTLGMIAACHYVYTTSIGHFFGIQDFKIGLSEVAALLTLVGYSVNDTIVVFDRIREVRGKSPALTPQMINDSVNQTLTRTLLSSVTVWVVVIVLYIWGGEGVHLFAFVMVIGVIVGTYSSIYIASPLLLIFREGAMTQSQLDRTTKQSTSVTPR